MLQPELLSGQSFGLIADAHVHPGKTPPLPVKLAEIFEGVDRILALGDMGEASGLDTLAKIAPITAIAGEDDAHGDARLAPLRLLECGKISIAALFDGAKNGLFAANDPVRPIDEFEAALLRKFGCTPQVLLCAGTHKAFSAHAAGVFIVNPGSPTLADHPNVTILRIDGSSVCAEQFPL
jgi:putative phosphoesterase